MAGYIFFSYGLMALVAFANGDSKDLLLIQTSTGPVRGKLVTAFTMKEGRAFYGIPYADPPIGKMRFKPPVPVKPWTEVFDATRNALPCYQTYTKESLKISKMLGKTVRRPWSENCLTLNIWTPTKFYDEAPVGIFIHEGEFMTGTGIHPYYNLATFAVEADVVLFSFNYRLGAFGFLSLGTESLPGNLGLMDQHEMLKWTRRNVKNFGGKEDAIFFLGFEAGAASIGHHIILDKNSGLFKTGLCVGGAVTCPGAWQTKEDAAQLGKALTSNLGCESSNAIFEEECLQNAHPDDIVQASLTDSLITSIGFKPNIDGEFIKENPAEAMKAGRFNNNSVIMYTSTQESSLTFLSLNEDILTPDVSGLTEDAFLEAVKRSGLAHTDYEIRAIRDWYLGTRRSFNNTEIRDISVQLYSDGLIRCCADEFLKYAYEGGLVTFKAVLDAPDWKFPSWIGSHGYTMFPILLTETLNPKYNYSIQKKQLTMGTLQLAKVFGRKKVKEFQEIAPLYNHQEEPYLYYNYSIIHRKKYREGVCELWDKILPELRRINRKCNRQMSEL